MSDDTNLSFRMDRDLSLQLDRHVERMQAANPGIRVTKGDAVRSLLIAALQAATPAPTTPHGDR